MPLVNAKEMLTKAKEGHYAVGQFNINNLEWTKAVLLTAEELKSPVILGVSEGAGKYMCGYTTIVGMVKGMIDELNITVPVALHLDHGSYEGAKACIAAGFSSIMFDGSHYPIEENFAKTKELVILEDEFKACSDVLHVMTDDGSYARQGNVCVPLNEMLAAGETFDEIITIGPLIMMKFVVAAAKPYNVPVTASMNPIMIDGTGMCGGCRLTLNVDGKKVTKFACVDGPDFNGYEIDFDEAMSRGRMYCDFEKHAYEKACNLFKKEAK